MTQSLYHLFPIIDFGLLLILTEKAPAGATTIGYNSYTIMDWKTKNCSGNY